MDSPRTGRSGRLPDRSQVRSPLSRLQAGTRGGPVHPLPPKPQPVATEDQGVDQNSRQAILSTIESLKADIYNIRNENSDGEHFICDSDLRQVLSDDKIRDLLRGCIEPQNRAEVAQDVTGRALKILAILICIGKVDKIKAFIEHDQMQNRALDSLLPLEKLKLRDILVDSVAADDFYEKQWEFTAPSFLGRITPRFLDKRTILPFLRSKPLAEGGYGSVFLIDIDRRYRDPKFSPNDLFVRKELNLEDETYQNEVQVLSTLQHLNHPNILKLISCYSYGSKHNLISPYKPDGTLKKFLKAEKPAGFSHAEMLVAITSLASALWALHVVVLDDVLPTHKGQHQDLHHGNILVDGKAFILADFGLSRIKPLNSQSRTPVKGLVGFCKAPEGISLQTPYEEHETTRKADIFALGCMFTDTFVHSVRGPAGIAEFEESRKFQIGPVTYRLFHKGSEPNEAVNLWLNLIAKERDTDSAKELGSLLMAMLEISPEKRPSAAEVTKRLCMITASAFFEELGLKFTPLKKHPEALIELARFESWLWAQDFGLYSSSVSAQTAMDIFRETVDTLRQIGEELHEIQRSMPSIDNRSFTALQALIMKLLSRLAPEMLESSRSRHTSILLGRAETDNETRQAIRRAFKDNPEKSQLARMAHTAHLVAQVGKATETPDEPSFQILDGPIQVVERFDRYLVGKIQIEGSQRTVITESITYPDLVRKSTWLPRVHALCELLSSSAAAQVLHVPPFVGLFDNAKEYSWDLVYNFPRNHDGNTPQSRAVSLERVLCTQSEKSKPALEFKMKLAHKLVELLAGFHGVGWYHKDLRSNSVLFFTDDESDMDYEALDPYLIGFRHSRKASDDLTDGPPGNPAYQRYYHPDYVSIRSRHFKRFKSHYDIYSLGILLFEIGCWNTIGNIMAGDTKLPNDAFRERLVKNGLGELRSSMSSQYAEVVRACLIDFDESGAELERGSLDLASISKFKQEVQEPLRLLAERFCSRPIDHKRKRSGTDTTMSSPQRQRTSYFR